MAVPHFRGLVWAACVMLAASQDAALPQPPVWPFDGDTTPTLFTTFGEYQHYPTTSDTAKRHPYLHVPV
ncbi:hypothetical protein JXA88_06455 [Candidatus Fermentibacteria bacterium]|nr:hypothetical protein [Candidatus Fermentibacteria bacterium]